MFSATPVGDEERMLDGTFSVVDALLEGQTVELVGDGDLQLQPDQTGPPSGPGRVRFALGYAPEELSPGTPHTQALTVALSGSDDEGRKILASRLEEGIVPMARYDLSGEAEVNGQPRQVRLETLYVDHRTPASVRQLCGSDNARSLVCGEGEGTGLQSVRAVVPNLWAPQIDVRAGGLRIHLEPQLNDSDLSDPYQAGKVVPACVLKLDKLRDGIDIDLLKAVEVFGYLLSFYAGRAVLPSAWEGETAAGDFWGIRALEVTPLPIEDRRTCLPRSSEVLGPFLARAWERWMGFDEEQQGRLRGVTNLYRFMLSATFPIERIMLTAMYLERFRELVVGTSKLLTAPGTFSRSKQDNVASDLREALRNAIDGNTRLDDSQKEILKRSLSRNPGKVQDLFRRSFKESLLELYEKASLEVDEGDLRDFIRQRDLVTHGSWDPSREGTMETYRWAEYGTNLIERLVLRFFGYEGNYYDRTTGKPEYFAHREASW